jgi:DNA-directed RNA polymerase delta subunit
MKNQEFAMADSDIDYAVVLADLKAKRDRLNAAIAGIETMLGLQSVITASATVTGTLSNAGELGPGAFLGMTIVEATAKLLSVRRQPLRTEEIVNELRRGGITFSTDTPVNTVGSVLHRDFSKGGEIVSIGRGQWSLAEWHPRVKKKKSQSPQSLNEAVDDAVDEAAVEMDLKTAPEEASQSDEAVQNDAESDRAPVKPKASSSLDDDIPF